MGRFLKNESQQDKTRAGKMMAAVGKAQSFASQQRYVVVAFHCIQPRAFKRHSKAQIYFAVYCYWQNLIGWHCVCHWFVCTRRWRHFGREPLPIL
jgi:hypothetical protein